MLHIFREKESRIGSLPSRYFFRSLQVTFRGRAGLFPVLAAFTIFAGLTGGMAAAQTYQAIECDGRSWICYPPGLGQHFWNCDENDKLDDPSQLCDLNSDWSCSMMAEVGEIFVSDYSSVIVRNNGKRLYESQGLVATKDSDQLRCGDDVKVAPNYFVVRHGRHGDLLHLVGVYDLKFYVLDVRLQDGQMLGVEMRSQGPFIHLGVNKDVFIQYCFHQGTWTSSAVLRGELSGACQKNAVTFFDGSEVEHSDDPPFRTKCRSYPQRHTEVTAEFLWHCTLRCDDMTGEITETDCRSENLPSQSGRLRPIQE